MPGKPKTKKRLTVPEFFRTALRYEKAQQAKAKATKDQTAAQNDLVAELQRQGVGSITTPRDYDGPFTRVTLVQASHMEYDADGIWRSLNTRQRRLAFNRNIDLNALAPAARKKVLDVLTKDELAAVTSYSLNLDGLSQAVQDDKIPAAVIAENSEEKKNAPYVSISHAKAK